MFVIAYTQVWFDLFLAVILTASIARFINMRVRNIWELQQAFHLFMQIFLWVVLNDTVISVGFWIRDLVQDRR